MENIQNIIDLIDRSIKNDPENNIMGGEIIADGYDEIVDQYRDTIDNSNRWLAEYQAEIIEKSGINNLKIKYTNASGYFIEVSKTQLSKIPDFFVHKQTLVNASRFITEQLQEFEAKIGEAQEQKAGREYELFLEIREQILGKSPDIQKAGDVTANLDFIASLSESAYKNNYVKPNITQGFDLDIKGGRHPVIEQNISEFISNDVSLTQEGFIHIITGPNMGGKSTFLRQNALIVLMSHIGSFVPAQSATIGLTDKIFSRVGANDNLYLGQSTFMVEMQEVANILHHSTQRSFVIIDEVGRGTSTYDGMSLAWAILKYNHDIVKAKTLFATHYHELVDESESLTGVKNYCVSVGENNDELVFLRKIVAGAMKKSFGLEVAKLAGLSQDVIDEAKHMLQKLEASHHGENINKQMSLGALVDSQPQIIEKVIPQESKVENMLQEIDINDLTPIEALNTLNTLKKHIK